MSIFWMRKRRLIISILLGMLSGALAAFALLYFFRATIHSQIYTEEEPITYEVVVLKNALRKGEIINSENLKKVNTNKDIPNSLTENELIGKEISIDMHENIALTKAMLTNVHSYESKDRLYEFSFIKLPNILEAGDFVDIRIRFKTGEDYLIAGKKEVFSLSKSEDKNLNFIELALSEEELLSISSAYVDSIVEPLCEVYLDKYINAESQIANTINYPINTEVARLFEDNPNIGKSSNIEEKIKNRMKLDSNMKKIIYENNRLIDYNLNKKDTDDAGVNESKIDNEQKDDLKDESN